MAPFDWLGSARLGDENRSSICQLGLENNRKILFLLEGPLFQKPPPTLPQFNGLLVGLFLAKIPALGQN